MLPISLMGLPNFEEELRTQYLLLQDEDRGGDIGAGDPNEGFGGGEGGAQGTEGGEEDSEEGTTTTTTTDGREKVSGFVDSWQEKYERTRDLIGIGDSATGFDDGKGSYVDRNYIGKETWGPNYNTELEPYFSEFNRRVDDNIRDGMSEQDAIDKAYDDLWEDIETAYQDSPWSQKQQKIQDFLGRVAAAAFTFGLSEIATLALLGGLFSEAKQRNPNLNAPDVLENFFDQMDLGKSPSEAAEEAFDLGPGEADEIVNGITGGENGFDNIPDEWNQGVTSSGYDPLGAKPFTSEGSPYQDLLSAIGGPMTGAELPPAYEQYRQDLMGARMEELKSVLPEVTAFTRERGIGAVGSLSSVYEQLRGQTERRTKDVVRQAQLETSAQALDAYTKGRAIEGDIALGTTGPLIDYLKGIRMAEISGEASKEVAGAQMRADKYQAQVGGALELYKLLTG